LWISFSTAPDRVLVQHLSFFHYKTYSSSLTQEIRLRQLWKYIIAKQKCHEIRSHEIPLISPQMTIRKTTDYQNPVKLTKKILKKAFSDFSVRKS